jgi:tetratricopeptide (TPR) repeat protein
MIFFSHHYMAKIICLFSLMLSLPFYSQNYSPAQLDSINTMHKNEGDLDKAINFNINALRKLEAPENIEGMATAYINLGNLLCTQSNYKESLFFLNKAKEHENKIKNPVLKSKMYYEYGRNYAWLRLFKQADDNFNRAIQFAKKIPNQKEKNHKLYYGYAGKWDNFDRMGETDSMYSMQYKCLKLSSEPYVFTKIANSYVIRKIHLDSAEYYLNKSMAIADQYPIHQKGTTLYTFGTLYTVKKEHEKALQYYFQALEIFQKMKSDVMIRNTYEYISDEYKSLNNNEKATEYYSKFSTLNNSMKLNNEKVFNSAVDQFIKEKEQEEKNKKNKLYILLAGTLIISLLVIFFLRKNYITKQRQKEELLEEKYLETVKLKKKINSSFDEVSQLAKTSDPLFTRRFIEVYPEFHEKLLAQNSALSTHDIKIAALLRLNFTNKEIADFENLTVRTIEAKRYKLKKKLGLPSKTDLKEWIFSL